MEDDRDPTGDLYHLMDVAGLDPANLMDTKRSFLKIVNSVRTTLASELKTYIEEREKKLLAEKGIDNA